jgi:MFS family permease
MLPLYLLFFRYRPEDKGLEAYGTAELSVVKGSRDDVAAIENPVSHDWTLGQAMRTYQLWLLVLSHLLYWGIGAYLVLAHQVKFVQDMGYSSLFAASVFTLFGICMAVGQLSTSMSDLIGREKTITLAVMLAIGAIVALASVRDTSQPWLLYVYAICFGCGAGLFAATVFTGMADIFHGRHFGVIAGLQLTGMGIGAAIGPWLGGYIYDISGSYSSAFVLCMVCFGLACIAFWIAAPRNAARLRARTTYLSE